MTHWHFEDYPYSEPQLLPLPNRIGSILLFQLDFGSCISEMLSLSLTSSLVFLKANKFLYNLEAARWENWFKLQLKPIIQHHIIISCWQKLWAADHGFTPESDNKARVVCWWHSIQPTCLKRLLRSCHSCCLIVRLVVHDIEIVNSSPLATIRRDIYVLACVWFTHLSRIHWGAALSWSACMCCRISANLALPTLIWV